jgi:hypothetical protein
LKSSKSVPRLGRRSEYDNFILKASKSVPRIGRRRELTPLVSNRERRVAVTAEVMGMLHGNLDSNVVTIINSYMHNLESMFRRYYFQKWRFCADFEGPPLPSPPHTRTRTRTRTIT